MRKLQERDFSYMRIPKSFWMLNWRVDVLDGANKKAVAQYLNAKFRGDKLSTKGLLLLGPHGAGKALFSSVVAQAFCSKGLDVLWMGAVEAQRLMATDGEYEEDMSWEERIRTVDVLVIDDLGSEVPFTRYGNMVAYIIQRRLDNGLETVINSRFVASQLDAAYGDGWTINVAGVMPMIELSSDHRKLKATTMQGAVSKAGVSKNGY